MTSSVLMQAINFFAEFERPSNGTNCAHQLVLISIALAHNKQAQTSCYNALGLE